MGLLSIMYNWVLPSKSAFLSHFKDNDFLYNSAVSLWASLDSSSIYFMLIFLAASLALVCFYYYVYNKLPGRKYTIKHWALWLIVTALATIAFTFGLGCLLVASPLVERYAFLLRISLVNGGYAVILYFVVSLIICNIPVPTNAYRFLKIGK
jgi:hypothetical protein